jgi:hypothetical protein
MADFFMRLWGMRAYRCSECQTRFYVPFSVDKKKMAEREWMKEQERAESKASRKKTS